MAGPPVRHHRAGSVPPGGAEAGTGLIGSSAAVLAFLAFLLVAAHVTAHLGTTTSVSAAGYDAARQVASRQVDHTDPRAVADARADAEARFREVLGSAGERASLTWAIDETTVRLRVTVDGPEVLPDGLADEAALGRIDRTFVVRIEAAR